MISAGPDHRRSTRPLICVQWHGFSGKVIDAIPYNLIIWKPYRANRNAGKHPITPRPSRCWARILRGTAASPRLIGPGHASGDIDVPTSHRPRFHQCPYFSTLCQQNMEVLIGGSICFLPFGPISTIRLRNMGKPGSREDRIERREDEAV